MFHVKPAQRVTATGRPRSSWNPRLPSAPRLASDSVEARLGPTTEARTSADADDRQSEGRRRQDHHCGEPCGGDGTAGAQCSGDRFGPPRQRKHRTGCRPPRRHPSSYEVLLGEIPIQDAIQSSPQSEHLFCVPATIDLAGAEIELVSMVAREGRLRSAIAGLPTDAFDFVFIDCPPSLGLLTVNALVAANEVLIPIQCEYYALEGWASCCATSNLSKHISTRRCMCRRSCSPCMTAGPSWPTKWRMRCGATSARRYWVRSSRVASRCRKHRGTEPVFLNTIRVHVAR